MTLQSGVQGLQRIQAAKSQRGRRIRTFILLPVTVLLLIAAGTNVAVWLFTRPAFDTVTQELDYRVTELVKNNKQIKNAVVVVMSGNGSFTWSGAAGIASQAGQVPMTKDTPIYVASITKLYTAAAIMRLYEQGALALDDPMSNYLPDDLIRGIHLYQGHDYSREITIEQLLAHTSGIADYYDQKPEGGQTGFEMMIAYPGRVWTVDETIARARDELKPNFKPGTDASYSDTNYQLLGKIIETVTGKPLQAVYEEFFFRPLDLKHTWLVGSSEPRVKPAVGPAEIFYHEMNITIIGSNGANWADGGLISTVEEMVIFLKALNEGKIISKDTLQLMHNWHPLRGLPFDYGFGTMRFELSPVVNMLLQVPSVWGHSGSTGSFLYYAPDLDLYMAGTTNYVADQRAPLILMIRVMKAFQSRPLR
jgi:D-alanyl-D-alanine carboxypeptidase